MKATEMIPVQFSESVSLANVKNYGADRCVSVCDQSTARRIKEEVSFGEVLDSVGFADSVYLYLDSTKRRFRSTVLYEPVMRPKGFSETCYILPRNTSLSYEATHEHHPNKVTRRWYSASLSYSPKEFNSGISLVGPDEVFGIQEVNPGANRQVLHDQKSVEKGRHRSTVEVNVTSIKSKPSDGNNNVMADNSYIIRYQNGGDTASTPNDQVVFRSAVKVAGNPE